MKIGLRTVIIHHRLDVTLRSVKYQELTSQNIHSGIHVNDNRNVCRCLVACEDDKFDCGNGRCISPSQVCDYFDNCNDEYLVDEAYCSYPTR